MANKTGWTDWKTAVQTTIISGEVLQLQVEIPRVLSSAKMRCKYLQASVLETCEVIWTRVWCISVKIRGRCQAWEMGCHGEDLGRL